MSAEPFEDWTKVTIEYKIVQHSKKVEVKLFDKYSKGERATVGDNVTADLKNQDDLQKPIFLGYDFKKIANYVYFLYYLLLTSSVQFNLCLFLIYCFLISIFSMCSHFFHFHCHAFSAFRRLCQCLRTLFGDHPVEIKFNVKHLKYFNLTKLNKKKIIKKIGRSKKQATC